MRRDYFVIVSVCASGNLDATLLTSGNLGGDCKFDLDNLDDV